MENPVKFPLNFTVSISKHIGRHHGEDEDKDEGSGWTPHGKFNKGDKAGCDDGGTIKWKPADEDKENNEDV